jgi:hypothetical protein
MSIINFYGDNDGQFAEVAAPGYFNDPDEVCTYAHTVVHALYKFSIGFSPLEADG